MERRPSRTESDRIQETLHPACSSFGNSRYDLASVTQTRLRRPPQNTTMPFLPSQRPLMLDASAPLSSSQFVTPSCLSASASGYTVNQPQTGWDTQVIDQSTDAWDSCLMLPTDDFFNVLSESSAILEASGLPFGAQYASFPLLGRIL